MFSQVTDDTFKLVTFQEFEVNEGSNDVVESTDPYFIVVYRDKIVLNTTDEKKANEKYESLIPNSSFEDVALFSRLRKKTVK